LRICALFILTSLVLIIASLTPASAQTPDHAPDTAAARVLACAPCHGAQGQGTNDPYFPRLAGKPAGYLFNQMVAFREGRRRYPPMNYLLQFQPDDSLRKMAEYFAEQRPPLPEQAAPSVSKEVMAVGETLVNQGAAERNIPACSSCHGVHFTGMEPGIPGLLGLRAKYISAQLGAWRYGTRTAIAPDCMQVVAGHLTEEDVNAIAAYLSSKPAPQDPSPAKKGSYALPFACGSQPN
jgi:cytochrome c553